MKFDAERIFFSDVSDGNSTTACSVVHGPWIPGTSLVLVRTGVFYFFFFDLGNSIEGIYIFMGCKSVTNYIFMIIFIFFLILIGTRS